MSHGLVSAFDAYPEDGKVLTRAVSRPCAAASCARKHANAALIWSSACVVAVERNFWLICWTWLTMYYSVPAIALTVLRTHGLREYIL